MNNLDKLLNTTIDSGAKKAGEGAVDRLLTPLINYVGDKYGRAKVYLGQGFERYLDNAIDRYNQVRTIATGQAPRNIIGTSGIYVNIGLLYKKQVISTESVDTILQVSNHILISGSGGIGKSMLMRYLFLSTAMQGDYIPVLVELRRINNQQAGDLSILELIYTCMQDFDVELPRDQFEYSLQLGKYLFLFDGLDEVKTTLSGETAEALQFFCSKYPKNPSIITSRPREAAFPLETFTILEPMPLNKSQAVRLAAQIRPEDEKAKDFCEQLEQTLFDQHKDFAENPLLLSMMFLTFMRNSSIPDHLADFYQKAYDALYSIHDSHDKGNYRRDFQCKELDEDGFTRVLALFCFQTYIKEIYEFSEEKINLWLDKSIQKLGLDYIKPKDYLADLCDIVCMLIKDGDTYRFSHRSFQTYFAAYYTSRVLTDEQQKQVFSALLFDGDHYFQKSDYYLLLSQIEPERFAENAVEDGLRALINEANARSNPPLYVLKSLYRAIQISDGQDIGGSKEQVRLGFSIISGPQRSTYYFNALSIFRRFVKQPPHNDIDFVENVNVIKTYLNDKLKTPINTMVSFSEIDESDNLSDSERDTLYSAILQCSGFPEVLAIAAKWLEELDAKRASLQSPSFIDDL